MTYMYNGLLGFYNHSKESKMSNIAFNLNSTVEQVKNDERKKVNLWKK